MNKKQLVARVARKTELNKKQTRQVLDDLIRCITEQLARGEPVTLVNFGTFRVLKRAKRVGRNPRTGDSVCIPP